MGIYSGYNSGRNAIQQRSFANDVVAKPQKDTNTLQDFIAGIDPTGVQTFKNATRNRKGHLKHKIVGNIGGFLGGMGIGAAIPAGLTGLGALVLRKKSPMLAQSLRTAAKTAINAANPFAIARSIKLAPLVGKWKSKATKVMAKQKKASKLYGKKMTKHKGNNTDVALDLASRKSSERTIKGATKASEKFIDYSDDISKKYLKGADPADALPESLGVLIAAGGGLGGGVLNALSANAQYNAAIKQRGAREAKQSATQAFRT